MNIEEWIKENTWRGHVSEQALRELLKTHAIVPREANHRMQEAIMINRSSNKHSVYFYKELIKAAEEE